MLLMAKRSLPSDQETAKYLGTSKINPPQSPLIKEDAFKSPLIRGGLEGFGARKQDLRGTRILLSNQPVEEILLIQPALIQWDNRCDLHRLQLPADLM